MSISISGQTNFSPGDGFTFGWRGGSVTHVGVINSILEQSNAPITVMGINYGWKYSLWCNNHIGGFCENIAGRVDTMGVNVSLTRADGSSIFTNFHAYNEYTPNFVKEEKTVTFDETRTRDLGKLTISVNGRDEGYWAGWYGPRIKDIYANLLYKPNPCLMNVLSDPSCPGYAEAFLKQQCHSNALYSPSCLGYQEAFVSQQCAMNPLYSQACSGYQQAFLLQQCATNPLYSAQCLGYADALKTQRIAQACSTNPQSSPQCTGYTVKIELPAPIPSDPIKDALPRVLNDVVVENVLSSKTENPQPIEIPRAPTSREDAKKQARETKKTEEAKKAPQASVARSQQANTPKGPQEQLVQAIQDSGPDISSYAVTVIPDIPFYKTTEIYTSSRIRDNERALRMMNQRSDRTHGRMIDEQYQR